MKETRKYGLFEKKDGKWVRIFPKLSFPKSIAVRIFQNALLAQAMQGMTERCLKPVDDDCPIQEDKCGNKY